jgi:hypothetical protein
MNLHYIYYYNWDIKLREVKKSEKVTQEVHGMNVKCMVMLTWQSTKSSIIGITADSVVPGLHYN